MAFQRALNAVELRLLASLEEKVNAPGGKDISQEALVEERVVLGNQLYSEKVSGLERGSTKRPEVQMPRYDLKREIPGESGRAIRSEVVKGKQGEGACVGNVYVSVVRTEVGHLDKHLTPGAQNPVHFLDDEDSVIQMLEAVPNLNSLNRR